MNSDFEKNIKQQLDLSLTTLNGFTQSQLTQARYRALEHTKTKSLHLSRWIAGFTSAAAVALLVLTLIPTMQIPDNQQLAAGPEQLLVSDMVDIDLYQNLEFYQWLDDSLGANNS